MKRLMKRQFNMHVEVHLFVTILQLPKESVMTRIKRLKQSLWMALLFTRVVSLTGGTSSVEATHKKWEDQRSECVEEGKGSITRSIGRSSQSIEKVQ